MAALNSNMNVNIVCRNLNDDRVLPRFSRYLKAENGWSLTARPDQQADVVYLSGYFESQMCKPWPSVPVVAHFTHREAGGGEKVKLFDTIAGRVQLRVAMAKMYADYLEKFGPTVHINPPVERDRFTIPKGKNKNIVAGFSGYSYRSGRKGESMAGQLLKSTSGIEWKASGRGWPVNTVRYSWSQMPGFFQSLDILVVTATIEGGPMPPLECLSCGVSVVIPRGVGVLDTLPNVLGIHRYDKGDFPSLLRAFKKAIKARSDVDRDEMRATTEPYTIKNWCEQHQDAIETVLNGANAGMLEDKESVTKPIEIISTPELVEHGTESRRGIYIVAFGNPARRCAQKLIQTIKKHMPEIPICLCASSKIGGEDILIKEEDSDIGGRRAKLKAYELTPAEWESVLYLDADTEVVGNIRFYFELIEDGFEFVIAKDPHLMDTMFAFRRHNNTEEMAETADKIHTLHTLQINGGVWSFGRGERVARFFARWQAEWEKYAQRDQGALVRAMYTEPLKLYILGNHWNTFPKYTRDIKTAGLFHYPGRARRWTGMIPGRIDSQTAWDAVKRYERKESPGPGRFQRPPQRRKSRR